MNKNTGDGELDEILKEFLDEVDYTLEVETPGVGDKDFYDRPFTQAKTAIKKWAAQEANKTQQQLLQGLMEQKKEFESRIDDVPVYLDAVPVSVIQNKLEGLS